MLTDSQLQSFFCSYFSLIFIVR